MWKEFVGVGIREDNKKKRRRNGDGIDMGQEDVEVKKGEIHKTHLRTNCRRLTKKGDIHPRQFIEECQTIEVEIIKVVLEKYPASLAQLFPAVLGHVPITDLRVQKEMNQTLCVYNEKWETLKLI